MILESIIRPLRGKSFPSYKEFLDAMRGRWVKYHKKLPVEIGARELIEIAVEKGWVNQSDSGSLTIVM